MSLGIYCGAFNPIHSGHLEAIKRVVRASSGVPVRVYATWAEKDLSRRCYPDWETKAELTAIAVESTGAEFNGEPADRMFDVIRDCCFEVADGTLTVYCGDDRVEAYEKMADSVLKRYRARGELGEVDVVVRSVMDRDSDSSAFSGTQMRRAVEEGDYGTFAEHSAMPDDTSTKEQYDVIRRTLKSKRLTESVEGDREKAEEFAAMLTEAGAKVYFVGGCVRDELMGETPNDFDMCATGAKMIGELFKEEIVSQHWVPLGLFFVIDYDGAEIEIISLSHGIERRLGESDLTINAIAKDAVSGDIIDPLDGKSDMKNKVLRLTPFYFESLKKKTRGLGMLRALRFVSKLGWDLEPESLDAIRDAVRAGTKLSKGINPERPKKEWSKLKSGEYAEKALDLAVETGLYQAMIEEIPGIDG